MIITRDFSSHSTVTNQAPSTILTDSSAADFSPVTPPVTPPLGQVCPAASGGSAALLSGMQECVISVPGGDVDHGRFTYQPPERKPYPGPIGFVRRHLFKSFVLAVFGGTALYLDLDALNVSFGSSSIIVNPEQSSF